MMGEANRAQSLDRLQEQTGGQVVDGTVGAFQSEQVYSADLSAERGEPVYLTCDYCLIRVPGRASENHKALVRKRFPDGREIYVSEWHTQRYARAWDAFLRGEDLRPTGTRLEDCPAVPAERILGLKQAQIHTVEELLNIPDSALRRVGHDARALQRAARAWLEERDSEESVKAEVVELRARLAQLEAAAKAATESSEGGDDDGDDQGDARGGSRRARDKRAG